MCSSSKIAIACLLAAAVLVVDAGKGSKQKKKMEVSSLAPYPGYTGALTAVLSSSLTFEVKSDGSLLVSYDVQFTEANAAGGLHIHSGTTCADAALVGGHYFSTNVDPWTTTWQSDITGAATGVFTVNSGVGYADNIGHAVVLHAADGSRIACGVLQEATKADKHAGHNHTATKGKGSTASKNSTKADKHAGHNHTATKGKGSKASKNSTKADKHAGHNHTAASPKKAKCHNKGKGKKGSKKGCADDAQAREGNTVVIAATIPADATSAQITSLEADVKAAVLAALQADPVTASTTAAQFSVKWDPSLQAFRVIFLDTFLGDTTIEAAAAVAKATTFTVADADGNAIVFGDVTTTITVEGSGSGSAFDEPSTAQHTGSAGNRHKAAVTGTLTSFGVAFVFIAVGAVLKYKIQKRKGFNVIEEEAAEPAKENTPLLA